MVTRFGAWLRHPSRAAGEHAAPDRDGAIARPLVARAAARDEEWVLLLSEGSAAVAGMYLDLLRQARIPALTREWGAGSGAFGGVPMGVQVLVPADALAAARQALNLADGEEARTDEG